MPPRGRPTLVVLSLVISSSVASFSSASSCDARTHTKTGEVSYSTTWSVPNTFVVEVLTTHTQHCR